MLAWLCQRTPSGSLHLLGSRICTTRVADRRQFLVWIKRWRTFSFGYGPRPTSSREARETRADLLAAHDWSDDWDRLPEAPPLPGEET